MYVTNIYEYIHRNVLHKYKHFKYLTDLYSKRKSHYFNIIYFLNHGNNFVFWIMF